MPNTPFSSNQQPDHVDSPDADEHEFALFAQTQHPLDIEAATWAARKRSGLDAQGQIELHAWLNAHPEHAGALADMETIWAELAQLPEHEVARLPHRQPHAHPQSPSTSGCAISPRPRWRDGFMHLTDKLFGCARPLIPAMGAMSVLLVILGTGWMGWTHWQQQAVFVQALTSSPGQQMRARLPDGADASATEGSILQLDAATRLEVHLYRDRREVRLLEGQVMLAVHPDAKRPFHLHVGAVRITVVGTRFAVRHTATGLSAGHTVVAVEEGRVRVARATAQAEAQMAPVELSRGQMIAADAQGQLGAVSRVSVDAVASWRSGRLDFDHTPLAQAIAEFARYGMTGLSVRDPAVAALPVGGSYTLAQWPRFVETLPMMLPVRLLRQGEKYEVIRR